MLKCYKNKEKTDLVCDVTDGRVKDLLNELQEKNLKIECMVEQLKKYEVQTHCHSSHENLCTINSLISLNTALYECKYTIYTKKLCRRTSKQKKDTEYCENLQNSAYTTDQKVEAYLEKSLMLTRALFGQKYGKNCEIYFQQK